MKEVKIERKKKKNIDVFPTIIKDMQVNIIKNTKDEDYNIVRSIIHNY